MRVIPCATDEISDSLSVKIRRSSLSTQAGTKFFATIVVLLAATSLFWVLSSSGIAMAAQTIVSLEFDDGLESQLTAKTILDNHDMKGTFFVISGRVDSDGYFTKEQLLAMQVDGHEIGGHTISHANLTDVNSSELTRQVVGDKTALEGLGLKISSFAYPFGSYDDLAINVVRDAGYSSARIVGDVGDWEDGWAENIPPENAYATKTPDSIKNITTLDEMKNYVTRAEQNGGGWVQIVMHDVGDNKDNTYTTNPTLLTAFLDWLKPRESQGTIVKTVTEVIDGVVTPPEPPATTNLFKNASLEDDTNADGFPDFWQIGYYGKSTYAYSRVGDAHSGSWAEKLEVTSIIAPADRKIASTQKDANGIPTAIPGKTYTVKIWYKSSQPVKLYGYYRTTAGTWKYWSETGFINAASGWTEASWMTKAVPADATALSFGVGLESVGWVIADDFSLVVN